MLYEKGLRLEPQALKHLWKMIGLLFDHNDKILARGPEQVRIADAQDIHLVGIALQRVTATGMDGLNLSRLRIELDLLRVSDVNLRKVVLIVTALHDLAVDKNLLVLQLFLGAEDIPCGVELMILTADGL